MFVWNQSVKTSNNVKICETDKIFHTVSASATTAAAQREVNQRRTDETNIFFREIFCPIWIYDLMFSENVYDRLVLVSADRSTGSDWKQIIDCLIEIIMGNLLWIDTARIKRKILWPLFDAEIVNRAILVLNGNAEFYVLRNFVRFVSTRWNKIHNAHHCDWRSLLIFGIFVIW